jgi:ABC-2 type transport system permease protein
MNWRNVRAIAQKDLTDVLQNKGVVIPMAIVPLFIIVLLPVIVIVVPTAFNIPPDELLKGQASMRSMFDRMPPALSQAFAGLNDVQTFIVFMLGFMFAPMFLILPMMFAIIIGADSFVGEKERKTIEALLYTPASDTDIFVGKVLTAVIPAIAVAWVSFAVYVVELNALAWPVMGRIWFPLPSWWPLMLWVTPALATLGISATVLISSRVKTFMEAQQLAGSLVVLVLVLVFGQVSGVLYLSVEAGIGIGVVVWLAAGALLWAGIRTFKRSEIIAKVA